MWLNAVHSDACVLTVVWLRFPPKVGCGAIGCEMLKNYALLGVGCGVEGLVSGVFANQDERSVHHGQ